MADRRLPGHIAAALAGNLADSAGRPWAGRDLAGAGADGGRNPLHNFEDDDGAADPGYEAAVAGLLSGTGDEAAVVASLAQARVFVPVVAQLAEPAEPGDGEPGETRTEGEHGHAGDRQADMALVSLRAPDGRKALPVFSSSAALTRWHSDARPVAVYAARAALSAVSDDTELLVVDPGSDFTFVVRRPAVWALARQQEWTPSYVDQVVADMVRDVAAELAPHPGSGHVGITRIEITPGSGIQARAAGGRLASGGGAGPELSLRVRLRDGLEREQVQALLQHLQQRLAKHREFVERVDSLEVRLAR
jgi:hypothetical protein